MLGLLWNPAEVNTYDAAFQDGAGVQSTGASMVAL